MTTMKYKVPTEEVQARGTISMRDLIIDFSHPDIIKARASAYALLLQWRKEREAQADQLLSKQHVNLSTNLRNSESEVYCPESKEGPTPAGSEQE